MSRNVDTRLDGCNKCVLHAPKPEHVSTPCLTSNSLPLQDGEVIGDATEQPSHAHFIDHDGGFLRTPGAHA
jgi:hypothetical protein